MNIIVRVIVRIYLFLLILNDTYKGEIIYIRWYELCALRDTRSNKRMDLGKVCL